MRVATTGAVRGGPDVSSSGTISTRRQYYGPPVGLQDLYKSQIRLKGTFTNFALNLLPACERKVQLALSITAAEAVQGGQRIVPGQPEARTKARSSLRYLNPVTGIPHLPSPFKPLDRDRDLE
jgi:hypothetical protein